ncbi:putative FBD domain-containing protein [Helianthus debilis subsp. tardiflorus]
MSLSFCVIFQNFKSLLTEGGARKKFPTAFPSLKAINLTRIGFSNGVMLSFALETIRHFSNLQTLEITGIMHHICFDPVPVLEVEYNMMELRSVVFNDFKGSENEVYLLKYFLACSLSLKKIVIHPDWSPALGEQFKLAKKFLKLHRASPIAEIHFD